nr:reverse transcriptase domain-containing protein [Tanacetum cinerariifolium]
MPSRRSDFRKRLGSKHIRSTSGSPKPRCGRSESPRKKGPERKTVFKRLEKGVFHRLGDKENGFMHGITNPELIKRLHDKILKSVDEMMTVTITFLRGEVASNREWKKSFPTWKQHEAGQKQNFKKGGFRNQQREVVHTTDECMHLKRKIKEMLRVGKLSHLIKELKQNNGKDQAKAAKKGETLGKDKPLAILTVQPWQRVAKQRITQTFSPDTVILFPPLGKEDGAEGPMIIEAEIGGHLFTACGMVTLRSSRILPLECTMVLRPGTQQPIIDQVIEEKIHVAIHLEYPKQTIAIGSTLIEEGRKELCGHTKIEWEAASLNRFLSKSAKKSLPFFKTLKKCTKKSDFQLTAEAETEFKQMNKSIAKLPMLTAPKEKEESIIYLAAAKEAISAVLMTERDEKQVPIYFISRALQGSEINYTPMEKLILALVSASKRLKRYFQAHIIIVITDQPIKQILSNPEVTGRLLKWSFELEEHDIHYRPRTSVKGQILADFIVQHSEDNPSVTPMEEEEELSDPWVLFADRSSCIDSSGASLILKNLEGMEFTYALRFRFDATNNEAEYKSLIADLRIAGQIGVKTLQANIDSRLVANQVTGAYIAKDPGMIKYLEKELKEKSIDEKEVLAVVEEEGRTWMTLVHGYHSKEILPEEKRKARSIRRKVGRYAVTNRVFDKKSFLRLWLRCVGPLQANYVLREIHEGSYSMHADPRFVVAKALRSGYYWLTMHADVNKLIRKCNSCQWGIDIAGPFPEGPGKVKFLIVAIDYFTKPFGRENRVGNNSGSKEQSYDEKKYYNARVRNTSFKPGDLVYRNNEERYAEDGGKLGPKWKGPYEVTKALGKGAYKLRDRYGNILQRTWNVCNLKKCYMHE